MNFKFFITIALTLLIGMNFASAQSTLKNIQQKSQDLSGISSESSEVAEGIISQKNSLRIKECLGLALMGASTLVGGFLVACEAPLTDSGNYWSLLSLYALGGYGTWLAANSAFELDDMQRLHDSRE